MRSQSDFAKNVNANCGMWDKSYQLDLAQQSPPIEYDLPIPTKKRQEKRTGQVLFVQ